MKNSHITPTNPNNGCLNFLAAFIILSIAIPSCLFRKELIQAQGERFFDQPKQERKLNLRK